MADEIQPDPKLLRRIEEARDEFQGWNGRLPTTGEEAQIYEREKAALERERAEERKRKADEYRKRKRGV